MSHFYIFLTFSTFLILCYSATIESESFCVDTNGDSCEEKGSLFFTELNQHKFLRFKEDFGGNYIRYVIESNNIFDVYLMDEANYKAIFLAKKETFNVFQDYSAEDTIEIRVDQENKLTKPILASRRWYYLVIRNKISEMNIIDYDLEIKLNDSAWIISLVVLSVLFIIGIIFCCLWINKH